MRKVGIALIALALLVVMVPAASAAESYCGIGWGSLPKDAGQMVTSPIVDLRVGRHPCYDRLVVDMNGPASGYRVEYVPQVTADASGQVVPLAGGAKLQIVARAPMYDENGPTFECDTSGLVDGFTTFRDVRCAGSFEGLSTIGLGVRARLPFRVFTLPGGRLVIDVAHRWA